MSDEISGKARRSGVTRCAIYTRKSSEEGLEQEFNSLDAQREACEAYIRSQKHGGWTMLGSHNDDGGISRHDGTYRAEAALVRYRYGRSTPSSYTKSIG